MMEVVGPVSVGVLEFSQPGMPHSRQAISAPSKQMPGSPPKGDLQLDSLYQGVIDDQYPRPSGLKAA